MHLVFINGKLIDPVFYKIRIREISDGKPRTVIKFEPTARKLVLKIRAGIAVRVVYLGPMSYWLDDGITNEVCFIDSENKEIKFETKHAEMKISNLEQQTIEKKKEYKV